MESETEPAHALVGCLWRDRAFAHRRWGYFAFTNLGQYRPPDVSSPSATVNGYYNALKARHNAWNYMSASRNDPASQASLQHGSRQMFR
jgi:hypothetical protein